MDILVKKLHGIIHSSCTKLFSQYGDWVSNARRQGDLNENVKIIADECKNIGNSSFGRSIMDKTKHTKIVYCTDLKSAKKQAAKPYFKDATEYQHEYFEVEMRKRETKQNMPVQIGAAIFQYAKLRMLQFYYDFLMEYIDASDFQMMYMDTDSCYIAITSDCIENLIKPEKKDLY